MSSRERPNGRQGSPGWTVVVPVKPAAIGKSRLAPFAGDHRTELARAMALDTVSAILECPTVVEVLAVTHDPESGSALAALGAVVVADEPDTGLNPALLHGAQAARQRRPDSAIGAMLADLPALRPDELMIVLDAALAHPTSFVPDAADVGTTLYCARDGSTFAPRFGGPSRAAHHQAGAAELSPPGIATVRRDVDTETDLREAVELGVGPRTRAALAFLL
ncbi:2-phospho-L-lactate guanylyltransferase [Actinopolymorpha alba]|uniref:2-phospho-L-lactate guanylyltransferase n=1 Tax=Actinopolymorpha alba TaxID=533267 RepID=UPI00036354C8|nr:2-phospho-L-lactate guanylyltransferase [Actinopolymorpha alba]